MILKLLKENYKTRNRIAKSKILVSGTIRVCSVCSVRSECSDLPTHSSKILYYLSLLLTTGKTGS